jgi:hypothetical protein
VAELAEALDSKSSDRETAFGKPKQVKTKNLRLRGTMALPCVADARSENGKWQPAWVDNEK